MNRDIPSGSNTTGGRIEIVDDESAERDLLVDREFNSQWERSLDRCPWSTSFQGPVFVNTWHRIYRPRFRPLIVLRRGLEGTLSGLLNLAIDRSTGEWVCAGAHQAEYRCWLATADDPGFLPEALELLRASGSVEGLGFNFLPPGTPIAALLESPTWSGRIEVREVSRPLMQLGDGESIRTSLRKKGSRSKINRLKKLGAFELRRVDDPEQLARAMDAIAARTGQTLKRFAKQGLSRVGLSSAGKRLSACSTGSAQANSR